MGLFKSLRNLFNKNIECGDELLSHFIYLYPLKNRVVNMGSSIVVRPGFAAVFVIGDKVCDVLPPGKQKITPITIPQSAEKCGLNKPNKYGNLPKKFKADVYFVSTGLRKNTDFNSNQPFLIKSETFGKVKGFAEGVFEITVPDPGQLIKMLLKEVAYIKNKTGLKNICFFVGNEANAVLEKSRVEFTEMLTNPKRLQEVLNPVVNEKLEFLGINVNNVEVTSFRLDRKSQKKVAEFLQEGKQALPEEENVPHSVLPQPVVFNKLSGSTEEQYELKKETMAEPALQPAASAEPFNPFLMRRGGGAAPAAPVSSVNVENAKIDTQSLLSGENKIVCKFCGEAIDSKFVFCPKCGFKQV